MGTPEKVPHGLEQHGDRISGNLPRRQLLLQAEELRLVDLHGPTPSRRRKSRTSG